LGSKIVAFKGNHLVRPK